MPTVLTVCATIRAGDFKPLIDICGVDYPSAPSVSTSSITCCR